MKFKAVSGTMLALLLTGMLILTASIQPVKAEPLPIVSLNPIEYTAQLGESFTIDVNITNIVPNGVVGGLGCWEFKLDYNTTILNAVCVHSTSDTTICYHWLPVNATGHFNWDEPPTIDDTIGRVWVAALFPYQQEFTGNGTLVRIDFIATAVGSCTLDLYDTWLGDRWADPIEHMSLDGSVTVVQPPPSPPVGGKATPINIPLNNPETPALWIWLTTIILSLSLSVVYVKKRKRNQSTLPSMHT